MSFNSFTRRSYLGRGVTFSLVDPSDGIQKGLPEPCVFPVNKLSQQYGGQHTARWVDNVPQSWIPYIQLARLSPPVSVISVLCPHIIGLLHGLLLNRSSSSSSLNLLDLSRSIGLLALGSFFLSNAIHGWNDLIDAPYDALVARTQQRPIVRGAVSKTGALIFTISQGIAGIMVLAFILPKPEQALCVAWPSILTNFYYPWAKRHTYFAQYVLGIAISWGVVVGTATALETTQKGSGVRVWEGTHAVSTICLTVAVALWIVVYDTIYAFQDRHDDLKLGLKSTAVLFGDWAKAFLSVNLSILAGLFAYVGYLNGWGLLYYCFMVGGCLLTLITMIIKVDLNDASDCWWWFQNQYRLAGGSILMALMSEALF